MDAPSEGVPPVFLRLPGGMYALVPWSSCSSRPDRAESSDLKQDLKQLLTSSSKFE